MKNLHDELKEMELSVGLVQKVYCKVYCKEEETTQFITMKRENQPLPYDVKHDETGYFRYVEVDLTQEEKSRFLICRQLSYLKSIKNSMIFFVVLTIISLISTFVILLR